MSIPCSCNHFVFLRSLNSTTTYSDKSPLFGFLPWLKTISFTVPISVLVVAPTGSAAFNVNAQTIHCQFGVSPHEFSNNLCTQASERMKNELKHLAMIIIDERSMVDCKTLRRVERNIKQTIYQGRNELFSWGAIPVVLVLGDDYQLPPVKNGLIHGFWNLCNIGKKKIVDKKTEDLEDMNADGDEEVSPLEFVEHMLKSMNKVVQHLLDELHRQFERLDADGSGGLEKDDLDILTEQKLSEQFLRDAESQF